MSCTAKGSGSKKAEKNHSEFLSEKEAFSILVDSVSPSNEVGEEEEAMSEVFTY